MRHPDEVPVPPAHQALPDQEHGVRPARALPYALDAHRRRPAQPTARSGSSSATPVEAAAVFHVRSGNSADAPRTYTVEPHKHLTDSWSVAANGASAYDLSVYGPNGFYRAFKGGSRAITARASTSAPTTIEHDNSIALEISESSVAAPPASASSTGTRPGGRRLELGPASPTRGAGRWRARAAGTTWRSPSMATRSSRTALAGHVENGEDSISDPLMGGLV